MAKQNEEAFYHKVTALEELVNRQQRALEMASELLDMKGQLIDLYQEETNLYKQENKRLRTSLIVCGVVLILNVIVHLIRLAH
jgi:hypothetical protein